MALFIWSDKCHSYSPYQFCDSVNCTINCSSFNDKAYVLDFAGGGAVHLLGTAMCLVLACVAV